MAPPPPPPPLGKVCGTIGGGGVAGGEVTTGGGSLSAMGIHASGYVTTGAPSAGAILNKKNSRVASPIESSTVGTSTIRSLVSPAAHDNLPDTGRKSRSAMASCPTVW
jgi:hypothetical protein